MKPEFDKLMKEITRRDQLRAEGKVPLTEALYELQEKHGVLPSAIEEKYGIVLATPDSSDVVEPLVSRLWWNPVPPDCIDRIQKILAFGIQASFGVADGNAPIVGPEMKLGAIPALNCEDG